jgi:acetyltransferase-like isoleucine patch superfamily enzyme
MNYLFHPYNFERLYWKISGFIYSLINRIIIFIWKGQCGKNLLCFGLSKFRILPGTTLKIGKNCELRSSHTSTLIGIYSPCIFSTLKVNAKIEIGDNCGFSGTVIGAAQSIIIGNNVRCGSNTLITDTDWHSEDVRVKNDASVFIDDNVWLGYGVKVLKGVSIGKNSIIGAMSVVTKDIPENVIAAGNPCKIISQLK